MLCNGPCRCNVCPIVRRSFFESAVTSLRISQEMRGKEQVLILVQGESRKSHKTLDLCQSIIALKFCNLIVCNSSGANSNYLLESIHGIFLCIAPFPTVQPTSPNLKTLTTFNIVIYHIVIHI
jgi:hypothetical protein